MEVVYLSELKGTYYLSNANLSSNLSYQVFSVT